MPLTRKSISVKGGGDLQYRQIDPTPGSSFTSMGYLKQVNLSDQYTMNESRDAAGNVIDYKESGQVLVVKGTLMQTTKTEIDVQRLAKGQYHEFYYYVLLNNGNTQEFSIPIARLKPGQALDFKMGERTIEMEIHALWPAANFTRTPTAYNVTQGVPYVLTEGATPNGAPTDSATTLAAAVL